MFKPLHALNLKCGEGNKLSVHNYNKVKGKTFQKRD